MIITYANYGIYDTNTCHSLEAGDFIQKLTYSDDLSYYCNHSLNTNTSIRVIGKAAVKQS